MLDRAHTAANALGIRRRNVKDSLGVEVRAEDRLVCPVSCNRAVGEAFNQVLAFTPLAILKVIHAVVEHGELVRLHTDRTSIVGQRNGLAIDREVLLALDDGVILGQTWRDLRKEGRAEYRDCGEGRQEGTLHASNNKEN